MTDPTVTLLAVSMVVGFVFGLVTHRSHFCTMGALSDVVSMGDWTRMRVWALAMATATLGLHTGVLLLGWDPQPSVYLSPRLLWLSNLTGGFVFGVGMVMASGCGSKTLVRLAAGNLKSLVVALTLAVVALISLKGMLALPRTQVFNEVFVDFNHAASLPAWLAGHGWVISAKTLPFGLAGCLLVWVFSAPALRKAQPAFTGISLGLAVTAAWWLTLGPGFVAEDPDTLQARYLATYNNRPEGMSYTAPIAHVMEWLAYFSDSSRRMTLGIACTLGVVAGAWLSAWQQGSFRIEGFRQVDDLKRHLWGASFMGVGGVLGLGCSIGQGITGVSTLSMGSLMALGGMMAGAVWRLRRDLHNA